jgi:DNA-binding winged helix-turn-helix (wHTH) protein
MRRFPITQPRQPGPRLLDSRAVGWAEASPSTISAIESFEFGRFTLLRRPRRLLADGAPVGLGTRAFDVLMVLVEADSALVTKRELLSRVWPDVVVEEENLKVQVSALRRALGRDRDFVLTEFGRGYRFAAAVRANPRAGSTDDAGGSPTASKIRDWIALQLTGINARLGRALAMLVAPPTRQRHRLS